MATYDSVAFRYIAAGSHPDHDTLASDDQTFLEPVVRDALRNVQPEVDEDVWFDVDRVGEVDVVAIQSVRDWWQHKHLVGDAAPDLVTDLLTQKDIHVNRQVMPVLLGRTGRQNDQLVHLDRIVHLGPCEAVERYSVAAFVMVRFLLFSWFRPLVPIPQDLLANVSSGASSDPLCFIIEC